MGVPFSIEDNVVRDALLSYGPLESVTRHPGVSNRSDYILAKFSAIKPAQQLLHHQKLVCFIFY